ncbi:hypothetical protein HPB50_011373 [Hyalomma asiaticum]|uniref:Uncharacterized protein n=1 Tax=Hyalomma asiaticum TaxID=266040 RepID=A0ACB7SMI6_HYAAI|nr:hypothetical protein HPB50_011373 [Hyalomma asiaticum]
MPCADEHSCSHGTRCLGLARSASAADDHSLEPLRRTWAPGSPTRHGNLGEQEVSPRGARGICKGPYEELYEGGLCRRALEQLGDSRAQEFSIEQLDYYVLADDGRCLPQAEKDDRITPPFALLFRKLKSAFSCRPCYSQLQLLKYGSRSFSCNLCDSAQHGGKPNDETEACATAATACSLQPRGSPTGPPLAPSGDLGEEVAGLRRLLLDALEGISFLSDEVSELREDTERVRKEHSRVAEQQVRIVASLRGEVRFLRDELTRRVAPKLASPPSPAKSPTTVQCDFSVKPDTPVTSDTETLPPFTPPPGFQRDGKLRVVDRAETSSANVTALLMRRGNAYRW